MDDENKSPGSVVGGILLIAGSCIGAGMLALPILTGLSGFFPSIVLYLVAWAFMTFTGLLLIEINGWFYERVNIVSMTQKAFGNIGAILSWVLYLFLFYSLLVGYIAVSGTIVSSFLYQTFSIVFEPYFASLTFVIIFGIFVYFGTKPVDIFNRLLMICLIVCYCGMILLGIDKVQTKLLTYVDLKYAVLPLSVLVISFGFHNMIPSLTAYMKGDLRRMRITIIGGSFAALVIYLIWNTLILGTIPCQGTNGLWDSYIHGKEATQVLYKFLGIGWATNFAQGFAFFAVITSFLAQSLGLMHFIADGLKLMPQKANKWWLCIVTLIPPMIFSFLYPEIFYKALSFAGGFCAVILFGIFPVLMVWIGRYKKKMITSYHVFGGRFFLIIALLFALFIVYREVISWVSFGG